MTGLGVAVKDLNIFMISSKKMIFQFNLKFFLVLAFSLLILLGSVDLAHAQTQNQRRGRDAAASVRSGIQRAAQPSFEAGSLDVSTRLPTLVGRGVAALLSLIAVAFFALTLYGGIRWMSARGNADETKKAKNTIIAAIAGIIVVMGSYAITDFVLNSIENQGSQAGLITSGGNCPAISQDGCANQPVGSSCTVADTGTGINVRLGGDGRCNLRTTGQFAQNPACVCNTITATNN